MIIKSISIYLLLGVMLLSIMFVNSFSRSKSSYAKTLGLFCLSLQVYLLGYLLEINSESLANMIFWNKIQYLAIPFFPALWLIVTMLYTGRRKYLKGIGSIILFAMPCLTFIIRMTNDYHFLYYKKIELKTVGSLQLMYLTKGPWYFVQMTYILTVLIICTIILFKRYQHCQPYEKIQYRLSLIASLIPYVGLILGTVIIGGIGIDYTALTLPPCVYLLNLAVVRYNFLEIQSLARERVFEDSAEGLVLVNNFFQLVDFNESSQKFLGWFNIDLIMSEKIDSLFANHNELLQIVKKNENKIFPLKVNQLQCFVHVRVTEVLREKERIGRLITFEDVTAIEMLKKSLMESASTDELSGLNNRRRFKELAEEANKYAKQYQEPFTVLMMDLDFFKNINDTYGHNGGDQVIRDFSLLLSNNFRGTDIIGRMGGEEFAVIMINTNLQQAYQKAELFRKQIADHKTIFQNEILSITVSIGVAEKLNVDLSVDELINRADKAMYEAKKAGRNQVKMDNNSFI